MRFSSGYLPVIANIVNEGFMNLFNEEELEILKAEVRKGLKLFETEYEYPRNHGTLNDIGLALNKLGFYDEALSVLKKALHLKPNYATALNNMGVSYYYKEDYEKAREYYEKAHNSDPKDHLALSNLSEIYDMQGNYRKVVELAAKALEQNSKNFEAYFFMGHALYKEGYYRQAIINYELALGLSDDTKNLYSLKDYKVLTNLAKVYRKKKNIEKALKLCEKALKLNPEYQAALKLKNILQ